MLVFHVVFISLKHLYRLPYKQDSIGNFHLYVGGQEICCHAKLTDIPRHLVTCVVFKSDFLHRENGILRFGQNEQKTGL